MTYGDIPENTLKIVLGETYEGGTYTLQDELTQLQEDIIATNVFQLKNRQTAEDLQSLTVYTNTYVAVLVNGLFGDLCLISMKRNP